VEEKEKDSNEEDCEFLLSIDMYREVLIYFSFFSFASVQNNSTQIIKPSKSHTQSMLRLKDSLPIVILRIGM